MNSSCRFDYMYLSDHEALEHPYRAELLIPPNEWATNALTFATPEDARAYASDLMGRWFVPIDSRVVDTRTGEVV